MTNRVEDVLPQETGGERGKGSFFSDWVVPIVLGLAIGTAGVWAWPRLMHSQARRIVDGHVRGAESDDLERFERELRALGPAARDDVVKAMRALPAAELEAKIRVAHLLTGEPWFATVSLKELAKDPRSAPADRRAAACALVDAQNKEVDPELVLPIFEEWLHDLADYDHGHALLRLERMGRQGMFGSQWEARIRKAMLGVADRRRKAADDTAEYLEDDRAGALITLQMFLPDEEVEKELWSVARDETDGELPRINAIRSLSEAKVLEADDLGGWKAVAESRDDVVRQTVADNLHRAKLPEYDSILVPLQFDAAPFARSGAIETQIKRNRPTMLERFDELIEDSEELVRFTAMKAAGVFKSQSEGAAARAAMIVHILQESDNETDVTGAAIALKMMTDDKTYGFQPNDVHVNEEFVDEAALKTFMADAAGRRQAGEKWLAHFEGAQPWTDADRANVLEKLLRHPDPRNVERAKAELAKLRK